MYHGEWSKIADLRFPGSFRGVTNNIWVVPVNDIEGYRSDTITQCSRLYAALELNDHDFLMTGDIDMLPLSDYWHPHAHEITTYGHDLTGYGHYPICYIAMAGSRWREIMRLNSERLEAQMKRDMDFFPEAKSDDFYKYWFTDQEIVTLKLKPYCTNTLFRSYTRGQYSNGFAVGRVDRGAWSLNHSQFIDAHLFQQLYHKNNQDKFDKTMELLTSIWPEEDFKWFIDYTNEFRRLTGHV